MREGFIYAGQHVIDKKPLLDALAPDVLPLEPFCVRACSNACLSIHYAYG